MIVNDIEVNVTKADLDDFDVVECLSVMMDEEASDRQRMVAIPKLLKLVFKADWQRVKDELRKQHDGKLPNDAVMGFLNSCIEALNAKN